MPHTIKRVHAAYDGWTRILVAEVELSDGAVVKREMEDHGDAAAFLPYDAERRQALVIRQFRTPVLHRTGEDALLEAPAGLLDEDDPETCARREAMEELGLKARALEPVVAAWTMPGLSTERMHYFLIPYRPEDRVGAGGGVADEHERIEVVEMALPDLAAAADAGRITDTKLLLLLLTLRLRRPDLFAPRP